ncbi:MAG: hypothetical protein JSS49_07560 [Planctomycetes bacterium]|nr:hypothetical protein [Planctomycetota bacterium]
MIETVPTYRVSSLYLWNLFRQALYGALGLTVGWVVFLGISLWLLPGLPWNELLPFALSMISSLHSASESESRELARYGLGPAIALCVIPAGLADISSWMAVQYEFHPDKLRMRWRRITRDISWDLIHSVEERPHADPVRRSLKIYQNDAQPILVRGLENLPEFIGQLKARLPRLARWEVSRVRVDLTSRATNFVVGLLLLIPLYATWIACYVFHSTVIELCWSVALLLSAFWIWVKHPLTRSHMCILEVEAFLAVLLLLASGLLSCSTALESSQMTRLLGW